MSMSKKKFQIGDLVDLHWAVKEANTGLAVIVDSEHEDADEDKKEVKYYTLLWPNGDVTIAHRVNIEQIKGQ
jgi:hypothetical protein